MTTKKAVKNEHPQRRRVTFRCAAGPKSDVCLAGDFNQWSTSAHRLSWKNDSRKHTGTILLPVGRYEYKFIVDGVWQCDPACADRVLNEHGSLNSVIEVK